MIAAVESEISTNDLCRIVQDLILAGETWRDRAGRRARVTSLACARWSSAAMGDALCGLGARESGVQRSVESRR